ncbi:hypothetical protein CTM50_06175 [Prevotella intermedia]|uniref:Uncharacterized protein n=1 Tax=Prevotella intermedia TaxID=28131 RepID=A0A2D3NB75_PREIN|nr:hypothetical protein CTM50_06175 [Prevotella intermedia]
MSKLLNINALQNLLFCIPKAAVLHGKSVGFASQNSRFRNAKSKLSFFIRIIFTKSEVISSICLKRQKGNCSLNKTLLFIIRFHLILILQMSIYAKTMLS